MKEKYEDKVFNQFWRSEKGRQILNWLNGRND